MHDIGLRHALFCRTHIRRPHVHGHCLDRHALRLRERFQQTHRRFELSLSDEIQHTRTVNVGQDAGIGMSLLGTLLIYAKVGNPFFGATQHAPLHCTNHDGVDRAPRQPCERADRLSGRACLQQLDDETHHQGGDTAVTLSPRHGQFFDGAVAVFELGHTGLDNGLELTGVQVPPLTLAPAINMRSPGGISWVRPHLPPLQNNLNHYTLVRQRKVYFLDRPRCLQSKKLLIQRCVFHV